MSKKGRSGKGRQPAAIAVVVVIAVVLAALYFIKPALYEEVISTFLGESAAAEPADADGGADAPAVPAEGTLAVHFIDVGQGDCIFAQLPNGKTMLVDAADKGCGDTICGYIDALGVTRIDYVVATHPHADHIGSMQPVIERYDIGEVWMPKVEHTSRTYQNLIAAIAGKGLKIKTAAEGVTMFEDGALKAVMVAPCADDYDDYNNWSAVIRLSFGENAFLLTGDAEKESIGPITMDVSADVLKVGHHGSVTSTTEEFLDRINPSIAVIQVGEGNDYGHPHKETLELFQKKGITVYRNNLNGDIVVTSDGKNLSVKTEK